MFWYNKSKQEEKYSVLRSTNYSLYLERERPATELEGIYIVPICEYDRKCRYNVH
jgi:hypothetical protein